MWKDKVTVAGPEEGLIPRLTFAARHGVVPHHIAVLEDARDGLRAVRFDESLLTQEGDGTAQLKVLTETLAVHWHTWVRALIVTEGCKDEKQKWVINDAREVEVSWNYLFETAGFRQKLFLK